MIYKAPRSIKNQGANSSYCNHSHATYTQLNTLTPSVWSSGFALASINVVALRQTRLVPGWVTVCGRVEHLGM